MDDFLKMDVFFVVATVGFALLAITGSIVLWRLGRILKEVEHVAGQVAAESDEIRKDIAAFRSDVRLGKGKVKSLLSFIGKIGKN